MRRRLILRRTGTLVAAALVVVIGFAGPAHAATAPRLKDPAAEGRRLSTEFLTLLQRGDTRGLAKFLDPTFQIQRTDGSGADRGEYLANPVKVTTFTIDPVLEARQRGDVLTVRWGVDVDSTIDGVSQRAGVAPRLSTYRWTANRWRMTSHANFNVPS